MRVAVRERISGLGGSFLEFVALTGVLVAQPVFDLLKTNAGLFILWRLNGLQLIAFTVVIVVVPALALLLIEAVVALAVPRARRMVHEALAAVVIFGIAVVVVKQATTLGPN